MAMQITTMGSTTYPNLSLTGDGKAYSLNSKDLNNMPIPHSNKPVEKKDTALWLDNLEYSIQIILPVVVLIVGLMGEPLGLSESERNTLVTSGLFASGLARHQK